MNEPRKPRKWSVETESEPHETETRELRPGWLELGLTAPEEKEDDLFEIFSFQFDFPTMAGVAQLGEQQTEAWAERDLLRLQGILEVPCSIHGPGIIFFFSFA